LGHLVRAEQAHLCVQRLVCVLGGVRADRVSENVCVPAHTASGLCRVHMCELVS